MSRDVAIASESQVVEDPHASSKSQSRRQRRSLVSETSIHGDGHDGEFGLSPGDVFDVRKVRKFIELMNEHDLAEIDLRQGDQRIRLRRGPEMVTVATSPAMAMPSTSSAATARRRSEAGATPCRR